MIAKLKPNRVLLVVVSIVAGLILLISFGIQPLWAQEPEGGEEPQLAALNPDFTAFRQAPPAEFYGYIPPPVDLRHLKNIPVSKPTLQAQAALPATFDWRTSGKVTPVKNQNPCGTCWIFGTLAAVESKVLIGENTTFDFSEQNVACCTDPSWTYLSADRCNGGGWSSLAADTLTKKGTRLESCDPYNTSTIKTETCNDTCTSIKYVTGYREVAATTADIKNAVQNQGPVSIAFYWDSGHYNSSTNIYYYPNCTTAANHLVCIVGWNDTIAQPGGGSGAWIVKNSWGTSWGGTCGYGSEKGYFYLCYDSGHMEEAAYYEYKDCSPSEKIYYWDEAGWVGSLGYTSGNRTTAWMANVFNMTASGTLTNVDFWATSNNAAYAIYVYQDGNPANGLPAPLTSESGTCQEAGYYSIALTSPVSVSAGLPYTIAVKMTTPSYYYPLPIEYYVSGTCNPPIQTGVSYYRHTDTGHWADMASSGYNACVRARVQKSGVVSVAVTPASIAYGTVALGTSKNTTLGQHLTVTNNGTVAENFKIKSSNATRIGGTNWALGATPGNNTFAHAFSTNGGGSWSTMDVADNYYPLASNISPNGTQTFDLQISMPTSTSDYAQHTIIITILAVAAG